MADRAIEPLKTVVIGQSLECWRAPLAGAVTRRYAAPLLRRARAQLDAGADAIDVNFGATGRAGLGADLTWAADVLRAALTDVPMFLDSGDIEALAGAVAVTPGPIVANAIPLEDEPSAKAMRLLDIVARAGAGAVFSPRAADRSDDTSAILGAAEEARAAAARAGVRGPLYLDCLTYPPATHPERCRRSIMWIASLRDAGLEDLRPLVAVGNLGYGTPASLRPALRAVYVTLCAAAGRPALILRAEDRELIALVAVLDGGSVPRTAFEEWALVTSKGTGDRRPSEPPGAAARAAWALLSS